MKSKEVIEVLGMLKAHISDIKKNVLEMNFWNGSEKKQRILNKMNEMVNVIEILEKQRRPPNKPQKQQDQELNTRNR